MNRLQAGFSLLEITLAVGILAITIVGLLMVFINGSALSESSKNLTFTISEANDIMEEIRDYNFSNIKSFYDGFTFALTEPLGMGVAYVEDTPEVGNPDDPINADLLRVIIDVSWQNKDGRIIGDDRDLDGAIDAGEDIDGNGRLDSIATVASFIARR